MPAYIKGAYRSWRPATRFPKPASIKVIFGKSLSAKELREKGKHLDSSLDDYQAISLGLREEVKKLRETIEKL